MYTYLDQAIDVATAQLQRNQKPTSASVLEKLASVSSKKAKPKDKATPIIDLTNNALNKATAKATREKSLLQF